jgi:photosystem II stability/assembly factor-like uncharacterized protein
MKTFDFGRGRLRRRRPNLQPLENRWLLSGQPTASFEQLPLAFEVNQGQAAAGVSFVAHGGGATLDLTPTTAALSTAAGALQMQLVGASASATPVAIGELPGKTNYLIGSDSSQWITNVATYAQAELQSIYPGIDVVYHGSNEQLEYDFNLSGGANPGDIRLAFPGAAVPHIDASGNLVISTPGGIVVEHAPVIYQTINGVRESVSGGYEMLSDGQIGITLGPYDVSQPLTIDPVLSYSTYLGGNASQTGNGIAVDGNSNAYIVGTTTSLDFPTTSGAFNTVGPAVAFASTNGGTSWSVASRGLPNADINLLAVDPTNAQIAYASDTTSGIGVFKTTNGGTTWTAIDNGLPSSPTFSALVIDPLSPATLYVGGTSGLFKSTDGGASWKEIDSGLPAGFSNNTITIDPTTEGTLYVGGFGPHGLFKSTDGGTTWTAENNGVASTSIDVEAMAIAPSSPTTLYRSAVGTFYTSTDGGATWTTMAGSGLPSESAFSDLIVDPSNPDTLYASIRNKGVFKSTNGGGTWSETDSGLPAGFFSFASLAIDPSNPSVLYVSDEDGVFKSTDGAATWTSEAKGLTNNDIVAVAVSASSPQTIYAGANQTSDVFITKLNATGTAVYSTFLGAPLSAPAIAVDANGEATVAGTTSSASLPVVNGFQTTSHNSIAIGYVAQLNAAGNALSYSTYLGGTSGAISDAPVGIGSLPVGNPGLLGDFATSIAADNAGNVYVAGSTTSTDFPTTAGAFDSSFSDKSFFVSTDAGKNFAAGAVGLPDAGIASQAIDTASPSTMYVATEAFGGNGLFESTDSGATWTSIAAGLPASYAHASIIAGLAVAPTTPAPTLYLAGDVLGVFKSADGGAHWTDITAGLPDRSIFRIVLDPSNSSTLYVVDDAGLFKTTDGGSTWNKLTLPANFDATSLAVAPSNGSVMYVVGFSTSGGSEALLKSTDGGAIWSDTGLADTNGAGFVAVDPTNASIVYVATPDGGMVKSSDGGATFSSIQNALPTPSSSTQISVAGFAFDPQNAATIYLSLAATTSTTAFSSATVTQTFKSNDGGAHWTKIADIGGNIAIDPTIDSRVYLAGGGTLFDGFVTKINTRATGAASLVFSTFLGGEANDHADGIAIDGASTPNIYVTGDTNSPNFPTTSGSFEPSFSGGATDAFVTKLNGSGATLSYSSYLGGSNVDLGRGIAVDQNGAAYVVGSTTSPNFPTQNAFQAALKAAGAENAFVSKVSADGSSLVYSTYLGGSANDTGAAIAVDKSDQATVTGTANSADFPTVNPVPPPSGGLGNGDAFVTQFTASGSSVNYSTLLGGSGSDSGNGVAVDPQGDVDVTGTTSSTNLRTANAWQSTLTGSQDPFVVQLTTVQPGQVQFSAATYNASETDPSVTITLTRSDGSSGAVSVVVGVNGGSAVAGTDFNFTSQTVTWADGDIANKTVTIPLIDDNATGESDQTVNLTLGNATGGATIGTQNTATLTIAEDNDGGQTATYLNGQAGDSTAVTFIHNLYRETLGREPDAGGQSFWLNVYAQAAAGGSAAIAQQTLVAGFLGSLEYREHLVEGMYEEFLHRTAEVAGLQFWAAKMAAGEDEKNALAEIVGSGEYFADAGNTVPGFVAALYRDLLGRSADTGGATFWANFFTSPPPALSSLALPQNLRTALAQVFLSTPEANQKLLNGNFPAAAGGVGAPGTPAVGAYALADITGNGWDNLYFQGTLSTAAADALFAELQAGAAYDAVIADMLDMSQYVAQ